jgi:hypothetical protein
MQANRFYSLLLSCALLLAAVGFTSMHGVRADADSLAMSVAADYSCTLTVENSYGSPAKSVKVSTDVSGGMSCIGGRSFYTDSSGEVTLEWSAGCKLLKVYVDGRGYDVDFKDGKRYTLTMK